MLLAGGVGDDGVCELSGGDGLEVRGFGGCDEVGDVDYQRGSGEDVDSVGMVWACCVVGLGSGEDVWYDEREDGEECSEHFGLEK